MSAGLLGWALLLWFGLLVAAMANGVFRVKLTEPRLGAYSAHVIHSLAL